MAARFKIPLQSEIAAYIQNKMNWPLAFCSYYADRFWNHYAASGWKLSNGNQIKSWQACFNSNWQTLKFHEDIKMFQQYSPAKIVPMHPPKPTTDIERMDALLLKYSKNPSGYSIESVKRWPAHSIEDCYRVIKENRLWDPSLTKQDIERMQADQVLLKATVIIRTLNYYGLKGWMFSDTINARNKLVK